MGATVVLASCGSVGTVQVRWSFADHRTCAEANVVDVVVRAGPRELARAPCEQGSLTLDVDRSRRLVVEALAHHGTALYRGRIGAPSDAVDVVLRFVGGEPSPNRTR